MVRAYAITRADRVEKDVTFFDVLRYAAGYWRRQPARLAAAMIFYIGAAIVDSYIPNMLAAFLKSVRSGDGANLVWRHLAFFLGAYLLYQFMQLTGAAIYNLFEVRLYKQVVDDAFAHVQRLSESFFVNSFTGSIITRITRARQRIESFEDQILLNLMPTCVVLASSAWFLSRRFPALAILMVGYLAVLIVISAFVMMRVVGPAQGEAATAQDRHGAHLADSIGGMPTTKSFAQEDFELGNYRDTTEYVRGKVQRSYLLSSFAGQLQRLLIIGMLALLLGGGTWYFLHGQASVESMAYLAFAYTIIQSYIRNLGENLKNVMTSSYDLHAIVALFREPPEDHHDDLPQMQVTRGRIEFQNVSFTYPGKTRAVFTDLSVAIRPGERVALIGHSGSGKSSFVRLLQSLYAPQKGVISVDGQSTTQFSRRSLRRAIALVPQDPVLFHRTLAQNIAYGRTDATPDMIRAAARQANIDDFIMGLPEGYDTLVGERGVKLSGGERQRVAIARALLADRPILILDEATSSLDSASERAIQDALFKLTHGRTSIMIAHRLSTIMDADRILVFDDGRIVEEGTHAQLIAQGGAYAGFFEIQTGGFLASD